MHTIHRSVGMLLFATVFLANYCAVYQRRKKEAVLAILLLFCLSGKTCTRTPKNKKNHLFVCFLHFSCSFCYSASASSDSFLIGLCAENVSGHPQSNVLHRKVDNRVLCFLKECFVCVNKDLFLPVSREKKDRQFWSELYASKLTK